MTAPLTLELHGLKEAQAALAQFSGEVAETFQGAALQAYDEVILAAEGMGYNYPAATAANAPPTPYYIRGRGTEYASYNAGNSERLGTQYYVQATTYGAEVGNRASYAEFVVGEKQAGAMKRIGWRTLIDVATEKLPEITAVFQKWIDRLIERVGL